MKDPRFQDRLTLATDYLACMRALGDELVKAMRAISESALTDLEESVSNQQALSARLHILAEALSTRLEDKAGTSALPLNGELVGQIYAAIEVLQNLNQCYAALLRHSSRYTGQMASLFQLFRGEGATGAVSKHRMLSCQI